MKRRIVLKAQNGTGDIKPLSPDESFKIYKDLPIERPNREPTVVDKVFKGFEYALNPFMIVSDYLQDKEWVPNWIKSASPYVATAAGMKVAGGKPGRPGAIGQRAMGKNPAAARGQNKNIEAAKVEANLNSDHLINADGNTRGALARQRRAQSVYISNQAKASRAIDEFIPTLEKEFTIPTKGTIESNTQYLNRLSSDYLQWQISRGVTAKNLRFGPKVEYEVVQNPTIGRPRGSKNAPKQEATNSAGLPNTGRRAESPKLTGRGRPSKAFSDQTYEYFKTTTPKNFTNKKQISTNNLRTFQKQMKDWFSFKTRYEEELRAAGNSAEIAKLRARNAKVEKDLRLAGYNPTEFQ